MATPLGPLFQYENRSDINKRLLSKDVLGSFGNSVCNKQAHRSFYTCLLSCLFLVTRSPAWHKFQHVQGLIAGIALATNVQPAAFQNPCPCMHVLPNIFQVTWYHCQDCKAQRSKPTVLVFLYFSFTNAFFKRIGLSKKPIKAF